MSGAGRVMRRRPARAAPALFALLAVLAVPPVQGAGTPVGDVLRDGEAAAPAGRVAVGCWRGVQRFPRTTHLDWGPASGTAGAERFSFGKGMAHLRGVADDGSAFAFSNNGWYEKDPEAWAPMLVFEPAAAGWFRLSGELTLTGGKPGERNLRWAVFRIRPDRSVAPIVLGRGARDRRIAIGEQTGYGGESLAAVSLAAGERLAVTAWYAAMYESGGAVLRGFAVEPAEPAARAAPAPLPRPAPGPGDRRYPADAGLVDVTQPPYGARGDGVTDDSEAIQRAMSEHNRGTVFLPNGTYLVSRQLRWQTAKGDRISHLMLLGESRERTILRLQDRCPLFTETDGDPDDTGALAVLRTESDSGPPDAAIENYIRNLTVDTGRGNDGAIGISFLGNNIAAVEDVTIRSGDGRGLVGLSLIRIPGPALVKNVQVEGFDYAARMREPLYNMVLDGFEMRGQRKAGIVNGGGMLTIHALRSSNAVPALVNAASKHPNATPEAPLPPVRYAMTQLVGARLEGGAPGEAAIVNASHLYARDVVASGYRAALQDGGRDLPGLSLEEFTGDAVLSLWEGTPRRALQLPVRETPPTYHSNDFAEWAGIAAFSNRFHRLHEPAPPPDAPAVAYPEKTKLDHTAAIQAALDSGRPIVYFPRGRYQVTAPLRVPPHVRRIAGMRSYVEVMDGPAGAWDDPTAPRPLFLFEGATPEPLTIELLNYADSVPRKRGGVVAIEHASPRPLVVRHCVIGGYRNRPGAGPLFAENNCMNGFVLDRQDAWFKQVDPEGQRLRIVNNGGRVSILGIKIEGGDTVVRTVGGGQTEVIGGFLRPSAGYPMNAPAYEIVEAQMSIVSCAMSWSDPRYGPRLDRDYHFYVRETRGGETRALTRADLERRGLVARSAGVLPLFAGFADPAFAPRPVERAPPAAPVPAPWRLRDLGWPDEAGTARFFGGGALVEQSGMGRYARGQDQRAGLGGAQDACSFLHVALPGDGDVAARMGALVQTYGQNLKAGLMLRASADAGAPALFAGVHVRPGRDKSRLREFVLLVREQPGAPMRVAAAAPAADLPAWVRLERRGGEAVASTSADGGRWEPFGRVAVPFAGAALCGTAVAGENLTHPATALFERLAVRDGEGKPVAGPDASAAAMAPWMAFDTAPDAPGLGLLHAGRAERIGGDAFRVTGSGWAFDSHEYVHLVCRQVRQGEQIVARVRWEGAAGELPKTAKAGIALRALPGHRDVQRAVLSLTPSGLLVERRLADESRKGLRPPAPAESPWLKLAFVGGAYLAYASADGAAWTLLDGWPSRTFPDCFLAGFFATSGNLAAQASARFEEVSVGPADVPAADAAAARAAAGAAP